MRSTTSWLLITASLVLALSTGTLAVATAATKPKTLKTKTMKVKPSGKSIRLQLIASGTKVSLTFAVKTKGKYKVIKTRKLPKALPEGASDFRLTAYQTGDAYEKNGGQGLIAWAGPEEGTDDDYAQYYGWNVDKKRLELFD